MLFWFVLTAAVIIIALFFRPVRIWLWGMWFWFKGLLLGKRAAGYTDVRRVGAELDHTFHNIKYHYLKKTVRDIQSWTGGPQQRLLKRLGTLRKNKEEIAAQQAELEQKVAEERQNAPRERPRIKGLLYSIVAVLLAIADIAITFMCLQALNYPVIFILPSAIMLGLIGFLAGDFLGKNIEPAQKNPNKEKNRMAIVLLGAFSGVYCLVFGTMRFLYTQHDPSVSLALNIFGSYGFISIIVGCSVMLGWLHEGITTEERLTHVKARRARIEVGIDRCDKQGAKMTDSFRAHLLALESESALLRSQFRSGFDNTWPGRAPYGVESPASPLEYDEDMLKSLTWPDPPSGTVTLKPRPATIVDYTRYEEPTPAIVSPAPVPTPKLQDPVPAPQQVRPTPQVAAPRATVQPPSRPLTPAFDDGPPPIG